MKRRTLVIIIMIFSLYACARHAEIHPTPDGGYQATASGEIEMRVEDGEKVYVVSTKENVPQVETSGGAGGFIKEVLTFGWLPFVD